MGISLLKISEKLQQSNLLIPNFPIVLGPPVKGLLMLHYIYNITNHSKDMIFAEFGSH